MGRVASPGRFNLQAELLTALVNFMLCDFQRQFDSSKPLGACFLSSGGGSGCVHLSCFFCLSLFGEQVKQLLAPVRIFAVHKEMKLSSGWLLAQQVYTRSAEEILVAFSLIAPFTRAIGS